MTTINIRSLSFGAKAAICWSFFWRGILLAIGSTLTGVILGGLLGFGLGAAGLSPESIMGVSWILGGVVGIVGGFFVYYIYIRWLLGSRLGRYRLVLVSAEETSNRSFQATAEGGA